MDDIEQVSFARGTLALLLEEVAVHLVICDGMGLSFVLIVRGRRVLLRLDVFHLVVSHVRVCH